MSAILLFFFCLVSLSFLSFLFLPSCELLEHFKIPCCPGGLSLVALGAKSSKFKCVTQRNVPICPSTAIPPSPAPEKSEPQAWLIPSALFRFGSRANQIHRLTQSLPETDHLTPPELLTETMTACQGSKGNYPNNLTARRRHREACIADTLTNRWVQRHSGESSLKALVSERGAVRKSWKW